MTFFISGTAISPRQWGRIAVLAAALALSPAHASFAQDGPGIIMGDAELGPRASTPDQMRALAAERGRIRVIVGFDTAFTTEGRLDSAATTQQRSNIAARQDQMLSQLSAPEGVARYETIPFVAMTVNPTDLDRILAMPGVATVELDIPVPPNMSDTTSLLNAPRLWNQNAGGQGTSVAILDTGVRPNHVAFSNGKIVGSACFSLNLTGWSTSLCPNGQNEMIRANGPRAGIDCDSSIAGCGHGTHVAAIAAGRMGGNHGMARDADIVSVQVFSRVDDPFDCGGSGAPCVLSWSSDQLKGLEQVMQWRNRHNIAAANMSLGGGQFFGLCDASRPSLAAIIGNLRSVGVATVIASGNDFYRDAVSAPSCISSAITAGSTTKQDDLSTFSNHAPMVNLLAPGSAIVAADVDGGRRALTTKWGTSMAAPHVAGAFAMLRSHNPDASVDEIERALVCSGVTVVENNMPKPRISMFDARRYLDNPDTERTWGFGNDRQFEQWTAMRGNWSRQGNRMEVTADQNTRWYMTQAPFCADNILADVRMRVLTSRNITEGAGVLISSEMTDTGDFSGLAFFFRKNGNGIDVAITEVNRYNGASDGGSFTTLCQTNNALPGTDPESMHRLRIFKRGNSLRFVMNGTEVCTAQTDARFANGKVGIAMNAAEFSGDRLIVGRVGLRALGGNKGYMSSASAPSLSDVFGSQNNGPVEGSLATAFSR